MKRMNYSTQFLDDAETNPITKKHLESDPKETFDLKRLIRESQKFILPDKGHLLYGPQGLPASAEVNRLPFPIIAIETTWEYPQTPGFLESVGKLEEFDSNCASRRLVLAFEVSEPKYGTIFRNRENEVVIDGTSILKEAPPEGQRIENPTGYVALALYRIDSMKAWALCSCGMYVPYDQSSAYLAPANVEVFEQKNKKEILKLSGIRMQSNPMHTAMMPVVALPGLFNDGYNEKDWHRTYKRIAHDVGEESRMIIELTMALSCSNVSLATDTPSQLLQKQRRAKKKPPLFDYHVLVINGQEVGSTSSGQKGTHASPRTHLRRGHLRRLPHREERIWINDTIVNPGNGFVTKDYALKA